MKKKIFLPLTVIFGLIGAGDVAGANATKANDVGVNLQSSLFQEGMRNGWNKAVCTAYLDLQQIQKEKANMSNVDYNTVLMRSAFWHVALRLYDRLFDILTTVGALPLMQAYSPWGADNANITIVPANNNAVVLNRQSPNINDVCQTLLGLTDLTPSNVLLAGYCGGRDLYLTVSNISYLLLLHRMKGNSVPLIEETLLHVWSLTSKYINILQIYGTPSPNIALKDFVEQRMREIFPAAAAAPAGGYGMIQAQAAPQQQTMTFKVQPKKVVAIEPMDHWWNYARQTIINDYIPCAIIGPKLSTIGQIYYFCGQGKVDGPFFRNIAGTPLKYYLFNPNRWFFSQNHQERVIYSHHRDGTARWLFLNKDGTPIPVFNATAKLKELFNDGLVTYKNGSIEDCITFTIDLYEPSGEISIVTAHIKPKPAVSYCWEEFFRTGGVIRDEDNVPLTYCNGKWQEFDGRVWKDCSIRRMISLYNRTFSVIELGNSTYSGVRRARMGFRNLNIMFVSDKLNKHFQKKAPCFDIFRLKNKGNPCIMAISSEDYPEYYFTLQDGEWLKSDVHRYGSQKASNMWMPLTVMEMFNLFNHKFQMVYLTVSGKNPELTINKLPNQSVEIKGVVDATQATRQEVNLDIYVDEEEKEKLITFDPSGGWRKTTDKTTDKTTNVFDPMCCLRFV